MDECLREVLLRRGACDAELAADFFDREAGKPVKQQCGRVFRWQFVQGSLQALQSLVCLGGGGRVVARCKLELSEELGDVDGLRSIRFTQGVLVYDMACHSEQVRLRAADDLVLGDAHEAKEYFLGEIGHVGGVSGAAGYEAAQAVAVLGSQGGYEGFLGFWDQAAASKDGRSPLR